MTEVTASPLDFVRGRFAAWGLPFAHDGEVPGQWRGECPRCRQGRRIVFEQTTHDHLLIVDRECTCLPYEVIRQLGLGEYARPWIPPGMRAETARKVHKVRDYFLAPGATPVGADGYERMTNALFAGGFDCTRSDPDAVRGVGRYDCPACGASGKKNGLKVDRAPETGRAKFWCNTCGAGDEVLKALGLTWDDIGAKPKVEPRKAQPVATEPIHLEAARAVFSKWLHIDDDAAMLYVAATIAANNAEGDPLWTLLVGPPSAGKTELAMATAGLPYVHPAATITESSLMSGVSRKEHDKGATGGLLKQIGNYGIILAKDFTSVLSQNKDTAASALAALREVYDGGWYRPVGTGGGRVLTWEGKVGLLGCVTPSIDRFAQVVGALGDRYLLLRLPDADPRSMATAALNQGNAQKTMRAELAEAMTGLILGADLDKVSRELDEDEQERLIKMAEYTARARTTVERNTYTREVEVIPQPEGTARLVGQMRRLFGGLEAVGCPPGIAWGVVERVSRDCVPAIRTRVIELLLKVDEISTAKVAESLRIDWKTAQRHLEDLRLLDLAEVRIEEGKTNTSIYWHRATEWLHEHRP